MFQLSKGSLKKMLDGQDVSNPVLQILALKNIQNNMDGMTRYKVTLYDGDSQHNFGILATQKNNLVENGSMKIGSVIRLEEFASNILSKEPPKIVVILLNFEIIGEMDPKPQTPSLNEPLVKKESAVEQNIKNDENIEPKKDAHPSNAKSFFNNKDMPQGPTKNVKTEKLPLSTPASTGSNSQSGMFNNFKIVGISSLNPYQNKWSIKARVINKTNIKTYKNAKGEGRLFNVEFKDQTGEIRATCFNEQLDKFYDNLIIDNVYYVSKAQLKTANRQYSKIDNDYEMTFGNETVVEPCHETENIPRADLNLIPLEELSKVEPGQYVDLIAIVKSVGELNTIVTKATGKEVKKRELHLVDKTNSQINCTLWDKMAEDFDTNDHPVILLKGAKVSDYGGRSLGVGANSTMQLNPDIPQAHAIRGWFDQDYNADETKNLSDNRGGQSGGSDGTYTGSAPWKTFDTLKDEQIGMNDKPDYFQVNGIVLYAKKDNSMYMACPGDKCNKKVVDQNDGNYRCEKCNRNYPNFNWRLILSVNLCDYSDSNWVTLFQEQAECVLEVSAQQLGDLKNSNESSYDEVFANAVFKEYTFKLRAKQETYNDEKRLKINGVSAAPLNYIDESKRLIEIIKPYVP